LACVLSPLKAAAFAHDDASVMRLCDTPVTTGSSR
jgi:hypothetical protein